MIQSEEDFRLDCLARAVLGMTKEQKLAWASKQKPAFRDTMRHRMQRIRDERRAACNEANNPKHP